MPLKSFDHVNVLTSDVDGMAAWYDDVLGMKKGWRPNFSVGGAWLYLGDAALVHLVDTDDAGRTGRIEHFAFTASGIEAFRAHLAERSIEARELPVPGTSIVQVNIHDPDGNHIHIDFDLSVEG